MNMISRIAGALSGIDKTPDAVDWANIFSISSPASNAAKTIGGINTPISLRATISSFSTTGTGGRQFIVYVNGTPTSVGAANGAQLNFTVNSGDSVYFEATQGGLRGGTVPSWSGTITVTNQSDGGVTIDTFTVYVEAA